MILVNDTPKNLGQSHLNSRRYPDFLIFVKLERKRFESNLVNLVNVDITFVEWANISSYSTEKYSPFLRWRDKRGNGLCNF